MWIFDLTGLGDGRANRIDAAETTSLFRSGLTILATDDRMGYSAA
jgi:hypothetical protein